jgi:AcrR family transcriptional regulator
MDRLNAEAGLDMTETGPKRYSSVSMQERRRRIGEAARQLITEQGLDGLTMAQVAERAGVALKTVYNVVAGKSDLIAQAVGKYQESLPDATCLPNEFDFDDILHSLADVCSRLVDEPGWGKAIVALYFSGDHGEGVSEQLRAVSRAHLRPSLDWLRRQGVLAPHAPISLIERQFAGTAYAILADWARGRMADRQLFPSLAFALATALLPAMQMTAWPAMINHATAFAAAADK